MSFRFLWTPMEELLERWTKTGEESINFNVIHWFPTMENSSRDGNTRPPYLPPTKLVCRSIQLEPNMEQQTGSKLGKEGIKAIYCHPVYLTSMQGWMNHKLESRNQDCQEKYQQPQICRWHHPYGKKRRGTKELFDEGGRGEWKSWLKTQHSKN